MVFIYPNTISTFKGGRDVAIASGYIEIEDDVYQGLVDTRLMWKGSSIVEDPTYKTRKQHEIEEAEAEAAQKAINDEIMRYKTLLSATDYKVIKYIEGEITEEEYLSAKEQRQSWRDRINELEG